MDWRELGEGACVAHDPDLWFAAADSHDAAIATTICRDECQVRETCLVHALKRPERYGIWGGLTEAERVRLRRAGR